MINAGSTRPGRSATGLVVVVCVAWLAVGCAISGGRGQASRTRGADHIGLTVLDLEASIGFFTRGLGFELRGRDAEYPAAFLSDGEITVTLWQAARPATATRFDRRNNVGLHHLAFRVSSQKALDELFEDLRNYPGVEVEFSPEPFYGGPARHMMLREPSGNRLEFIFRP